MQGIKDREGEQRKEKMRGGNRRNVKGREERGGKEGRGRELGEERGEREREGEGREVE